MGTAPKKLSLYVCIRKVEVIRRITILFTLGILFYGCAQQGAPSGGLKDETPPVVVEAEPQNYSTFFEARKILITFDEYIVLDNVNQELIVSPPFEEKPEVKLRKKTIIIEFEEELRENTTYTFNFGSSIKDLHEGNKLINYEYVFATGAEIDSLSVRGMIKNSFDHTVLKDPVTIMLYDDLRDSVPLTDIPLYVGKSQPDGNFSVNNLKSEVYKLFAIKDANYNFLFDQPNEEIAFLDSNLIVSAEYFRSVLREDGLLDSMQMLIDSLHTLADSAVIDQDSLNQILPNLNAVYVDLFMFTEESELQFLTDYKREDPRKLELIFNRPLTDSFKYKLIGSDTPNNELFLEIFSKEQDSLLLWITDSLYYKNDTMGLAIMYTGRDSLDTPVTMIDSLQMNYRRVETKTNKRKSNQNESDEKSEKLVANTIRRGQKQNLNSGLIFNFDFPITDVEKSFINLFEIPDTTELPVSFSVGMDSVKYNRARLHHKWKSDMKYRLQVLPGAFKNLYDLPHDTIDLSFSGQDSEHYGRIILNLENVMDRVIIQLMIKQNVILEKTIDSSGSYEFPYLQPETYQIKFIHDRNGNGKWDTGKYIRNQQPEKVEFLPVEITVRSNWDHDATHALEN